jgi:tRNA-dihydrouridine synthase B
LIRPLQLGNLHFPTNLIQGPLAGVSCAPFRALTWEYGQPAFSYTEMISAKTLIHHDLNLQKRFIHKDPNEGPVCFQLAASDPRDLAEAVKRATASGADLIDLNCGCPVKKIRSKGAGSRLLTDPLKLYQLITAMKQHTSVPVSVKIRVEGGSQDRFNAEVAKVVAEAGADFLVVHGRHWTEHYETPCHYDHIAFFVNELSIPVIGNGDVRCVASLKKMLLTGCAGVMISRAGVGKPWLIKKLIAEMRHEIFQPPTLALQMDLFVRHVTELAVLLNNEKQALLQARGFAKYYVRECGVQPEFYADLNRCESLLELQQIIAK